MPLSDKSLRKALADGSLKLSDWSEPAQSIGAASIDLRLNKTIGVFTGGPDVIDPSSNVAQTAATTALDIPEQGYLLQPGESVIACTHEMMTVPKSATAQIFEKSSLARLGLMVSPTYANPGYEGHLPIRVTNGAQKPFKLLPLMKFCQLVLHPLDTAASIDYQLQPGAKYLRDPAGAPSKSFEDFLGSSKAEVDSEAASFAASFVANHGQLRKP